VPNDGWWRSLGRAEQPEQRPRQSNFNSGLAGKREWSNWCEWVPLRPPRPLSPMSPVKGQTPQSRTPFRADEHRHTRRPTTAGDAEMLTGLIPPSIAADKGRPTGGATTGQPTSYTLLRYARKRDSTDTSHLTTTRTPPRTQLPCQTRRGHSSSSESQFTQASEASQRTWGGCLFLRR
jgi:hypothetical protein